jgi:hypothetical protein
LKTVEETYRPRLERQFLPWCSAANARLAGEPSKVVETLTREEVASMEKAATGRDAPIVRLLADTGI